MYDECWLEFPDKLGQVVTQDQFPTNRNQFCKPCLPSGWAVITLKFIFSLQHLLHARLQNKTGWF